MVNKVKNRVIRDTAEANTSATKMPVRVGRPPANGVAPQRIRVGPVPMRRWLAALQAAHNAPRAASTRQALAAAMADIQTRLGPLADPDYKPPKAGDAGAKRKKWRVTQADGTDTVHSTVAGAAKAYGCAPSSLRVMLSRGRGKCQRAEPYKGSESQVTCETWHETCSSA